MSFWWLLGYTEKREEFIQPDSRIQHIFFRTMEELKENNVKLRRVKSKRKKRR